METSEPDHTQPQTTPPPTPKPPVTMTRREFNTKMIGASALGVAGAAGVIVGGPPAIGWADEKVNPEAEGLNYQKTTVGVIKVTAPAATPTPPSRSSRDTNTSPPTLRLQTQQTDSLLAKLELLSGTSLAGTKYADLTSKTDPTVRDRIVKVIDRLTSARSNLQLVQNIEIEQVQFVHDKKQSPKDRMVVYEYPGKGNKNCLVIRFTNFD